MNNTKLRICNACGWVHVALSRADVEEQARKFGEYITAQPPAVQAQFDLGPLSRSGRAWDYAEHVARFERCFRCGNPHTNFRDQTEQDHVPAGSTLQGIIKEAE